MKQDITEFGVQGSVQMIGRQLQEICAQLNATADQLESTSGGLAAFDEHADIEVVLSGRAGILSPQQWAVQVYVTRLDAGGCAVMLIALGDSTWAKVWSGTAGALKMSVSLAKREEIKKMLQ
ncbi:MAG: hypothetical protein LBN05_09070 [Oscillospiraceae bacterium]|jgi:5,10-methylene-tetrahydrofolate dehydrogenase/methenyl tetrahydrofolate cyclohydrolase|nr:hypothetical protein [Oscillospiraceae bacterium]